MMYDVPVTWYPKRGACDPSGITSQSCRDYYTPVSGWRSREPRYSPLGVEIALLPLTASLVVGATIGFMLSLPVRIQ